MCNEIGFEFVSGQIGLGQVIGQSARADFSGSWCRVEIDQWIGIAYCALGADALLAHHVSLGYECI
jgi:hypothetical protein